jgi:hypothetical protein
MPLVSPRAQSPNFGFKSMQYSSSERSGLLSANFRTQYAKTESGRNLIPKNKQGTNFGMNTRALNIGPFYKGKNTVINEEEEIFPDNCLTIFDNSGKHCFYLNFSQEQEFSPIH